MNIRDRVKELRRVKASELLPHPANWRVHPQEQKNALRGLLEEVGFAGAVVAYETPQGLQLIDGHLRVDAAPDAIVPVLVLDVTEEEARKLLAVLDPLGDLAATDTAKLDALLKEVETESEALATLLESLAPMSTNAVDAKVELKSLEVKPPPHMAWVLIGIPVVRYGEIAGAVEQIAKVNDIVCETVVNDG